MLKPHNYWDSLDYESMATEEQDGRDDKDAKEAKKRMEKNEEDLSRLKAEASRKERAAKVAALKAKKLASKTKALDPSDVVEANVSQQIESAMKDQNESVAKAKRVGELFERFVEKKKNGYNLLQIGNMAEATKDLNVALEDIRSLISETDTSTEIDHFDENSQCNSHSHEHSHSSTCSHNHEHSAHHHGNHQSCSHGHGHGGNGHGHEEEHVVRNETVEKEGNFLISLKDSEKEILMMLGQCYVTDQKWVNAVDTFREILLRDRSLSLAWILRATAFLEMGGPLLADLHLSQPQVNAEAKHVKNLLDRIKTLVASRQDKSFEELVESKADSLLQQLQGTTSHDLLGTTLQKEKAEADRLRLEGFYYSAAIKYGAAIRLIDQSESVRAEHHLFDTALISFLLSLAACHIERGNQFSDAVELCTRALFVQDGYGTENPKALFYRGEARRNLGQYGVALEDFRRAKRACLQILQSIDSGIESARGSPKVQFAVALKDSFVESKIEMAARIRGFLEQIKTSLRLCNVEWKKVGQLSIPRTKPTIACFGEMKLDWPMVLSRPFSVGKKQPFPAHRFTAMPVVAIVVLSTEEPLEFSKNLVEQSIILTDCYDVSGNVDDSILSILEGGVFTESDATKPFFVNEFIKTGYKLVGLGDLASGVLSSMSIDDDVPQLCSGLLEDELTTLIGAGKTPFFVASFEKMLEASSFIQDLHKHADNCISVVVERRNEGMKRKVRLISKTLFNAKDIGYTLFSNFRKGDKIQVANPSAIVGEFRWRDGIVIDTSNDMQTVDVLLLDGSDLREVELTRIRKRSSFSSEPRLLSSVVDILPTIHSYVSGKRIERANCLGFLGRDVSPILQGQSSGLDFYEHGNFVLYQSDCKSTISGVGLRPGDNEISPLSSGCLKTILARLNQPNSTS